MDEEEFENKLLEEKKEIFDEIENYAKKDNIEFIKFIIENHPPMRYKKEKKTIEEQWKENKKNLINVLCSKYHPAKYPKNTEEEKLRFLIAEKISEHLNKICCILNSNQYICEYDD